MSAYLKFFELESSPFDTSAQSKLVLGTKALRAAYKQIEDGLGEGAPRVCVSGKAGMGKTSLARALPKLLGTGARVVVLLNPALPWLTLRTAIIRQLELEEGALSRKTLIAARGPAQRIVLVIDQAEKISKESLEHLDILLNYRDDDDGQLVHAVLLANLEQASQDDASALLWWLDSLTTLQLEFAPIPAKGIGVYIDKHLKRAGWKGDGLFTPEATQTIHRLTGGVPRAISELCEALLAEAAKRGVQRIGPEMVEDVSGEERSGGPTAEASDPEPIDEVGREPMPIEEPPTSLGSEPEPGPPEATSDSEHSASVSSMTGLDAYFGARGPTTVDSDESISGDTPSVDDLGTRGLRPIHSIAAVLAVLMIGGASWLAIGGRDTAETVQARPIAKRPSPPAKMITQVDSDAKAPATQPDAVAPLESALAAGSLPEEEALPKATPLELAEGRHTPFEATVATPPQMTSTSSRSSAGVRPKPLLAASEDEATPARARREQAAPAPASPSAGGPPPGFETDERHS